VQIPIELVLGPFGAVAVLLLWIQDLRKQRDAYQAQLAKLVDALESGLRRADAK
jgi:hypothetical protein